MEGHRDLVVRLRASMWREADNLDRKVFYNIPFIEVLPSEESSVNNCT